MARLNVVKSFRGTTKTEDGNLTCESCREKIEPGMSYRWWANKMRHQRGSFRHIRCMEAPCTPSQADMTPGRRGEWMRAEIALHQDIDAASTNEELESAAQAAAEAIREFAEQFTEGADNIEEGFGHPTSQSDELRERGEALEAICDELESLDFEEPDFEEWDEAAVRLEIAQDSNIAAEDREDEYMGRKHDHEAEEQQIESDWVEEQREKIRDQLNEVEV